MTITPSPKERVTKYRLIPHRGTSGSWDITGTEVQATLFAQELSVMRECSVLITELLDKGVPLHIKSVGPDGNTVKTGRNPKGGSRMGTTKMTPEPRVSNGTKAEVKQDLESSVVLTDDQKAELKKARATNGKKPRTAKPKATKKGAADKTDGPSKSSTKQACAERIRAMRSNLKWSGAEWSKDFTPQQLSDRCKTLIEQAQATIEYVDSLKS